MSTDIEAEIGLSNRAINWERRLDMIVATMREMSLHTDPQEMVKAYGARIRELRPLDALISVSRRNLSPPHYKITRSSRWETEINPWKQPDLLPQLQGGLLGRLLYDEKPVIIDELQVDPDDPAYEYLNGYGSLAAVPHYNGGAALNMVILLQTCPYAFSREEFPEMVWMSNLFGRATHNLVLTDQVQTAYDQLDLELKRVGEIQRSLLPAELPKIDGLQFATHYLPARRAGGDFYDFFPRPDGTWGILIADVSGHGTSAAVLMAITHAIAHLYPGHPETPAAMLAHLNSQLATRYTSSSSSFVTAFFGIYNPKTRQLVHASAGHPAPRLVTQQGEVKPLEVIACLPLGIFPEEQFFESMHQFEPGEQLVLFTDGITDTQDASATEYFGNRRLDAAIAASTGAFDAVAKVLTAIDLFSGGRPADDDQTLLAIQWDRE